MRNYYYYFIVILILILLLISHINSVEINKLKLKTSNQLSSIHKTINDIDENNKKVEFANNKYLYDVYEKNNDFTTLNIGEKKVRKVRFNDNNKEQKYNMMKSFYNFK